MVESSERFTHLLLDVEGTTCPVSYVSNTLFPYASQELNRFLKEYSNDNEIADLISQLRTAWEQEESEEARTLYQEAEPNSVDCTAYIQWLIREDKKITPLKSLQGKIWTIGYAKGDLKAPLFNDVAPALQYLNAQGIILGSYSSGSIEAQQLLYQHSNNGDLRQLFTHWFDTTIGNKKDQRSYKKISKAMGTDPQEVMFVSDVNEELQAASDSRMNTAFSLRDGNPQKESMGFRSIQSLAALISE